MATQALAAVMRISAAKSTKTEASWRDLLGADGDVTKVRDRASQWGFRPDNDCLVYDPAKVPSNEQQWDASRFVQKAHHGFYCCPEYSRVFLRKHTNTLPGT